MALCCHDVRVMCCHDVKVVCCHDLMVMCCHDLMVVCCHEVMAVCCRDVRVMCCYDVSVMCCHDLMVMCCRRYASFNASSELPSGIEEALVFWINKTCAALDQRGDLDIIQGESNQKVHRQQQEQQFLGDPTERAGQISVLNNHL